MPPQEISKPEGSSSPNDDNSATASKATNAASLYHHDQPTEDETEGCRKILEELSPEEIVSMPDDHMPLRHLRAEKVRDELGNARRLRMRAHRKAH